MGVDAHPLTQSIARRVAPLSAVVRPVSQSVVVHRLLGRLVVDVSALNAPVPPIAARALGGRPAQHPASPSEAAFVSTVPTADGPESETRVVPDESDDWAAAVEPRNRAERRAQQQAQTHAKGVRARR